MGNKRKKLPRLWQRCAGALHRWPLKWANKACCEVWNRYGQPWKNCKIHQKLSNCLKRWNLVPKQVTTRIRCKYGDKHDKILGKIFCSIFFHQWNLMWNEFFATKGTHPRGGSFPRFAFPRIVVVCLWNSLVMSSRCERLLINNGRLIGWLESGESWVRFEMDDF